VAVRIAGVTLPNKRIIIALTYVYGVGATIATDILKKLKIDESVRAEALSEDDLTKIRLEVDLVPHEGDLRRKVQNDMKRLQEVGCYRGYRHSRGLPCRGQRTQCNARTRKGKKVAIAGKKK